MTHSSRDKRKSGDPSNGVFLFMDKRRLLCGIIYNLHTLPRAGHHSGMQDFFPPLTVSAEYSSVVDWSREFLKNYFSTHLVIKGVLFFNLKLQTAYLAGLVNVGLVLWYAPVYWEVCQGQKSTSKSKPSLVLAEI